ncbi:nitrogen permease regulator of amino acid transport activity 3-domain-containing protein [Apodospora peruviana]|uniref:Nitrogen permease regulator 3 n=1 Tax=Apodospora peruviana TaxID=516989 RepID=A0AAE0IS81_9PEZI|nr:nitrogen permease regulator of amino acid transport activity 3-domain-containing protein [Apodospora peruviana]
MALPVLPSPSNFLAVALVINRSRDGPRFVFHYPPHVGPAQCSGAKPDGADDVDIDDDDDILLGRATRDGLKRSTSSDPDAAELSHWNHEDHLVTESGTQVVPWEYVAGFPTKDLENILTPARAYHKKLFQISLDPLLCVSYPVHVPENGVWRNKKKQQQQAPRKEDADAAAATDADASFRPADRRASDVDQIEARDIAKAAVKTVEETEDKKSSMTMFNLVFILNPKKHEAKDLVDVMFFHIIKKINKAYKYCQQRSDFVWKESKRILALKDKAREDKRTMSSLWDDILSTSSLAASMQDLYDAISRNRIAALQLDTPEGLVTHSVQIPVPFHISDLPQDDSDDQRGLWLTTANSLMGDDAVDEPDYVDKNFALLPMTDEKKIIAELQSDADETTLQMIEFVRHCKPTLSFYQVGQQSSNILTPAQVRKFAQHFIFWRRAIAIPPLHARDMYIVSPNCDMRRLPQAAAQWARQFPLSPPLPNFLAELSVAPRPYKLHCPSKAHRPVYMTMLAWLMRGGWVTQLCTFAYVVVWPEIVYEVEFAFEAEEIARAKRAQNRGGEPRSVEGEGDFSSTSAGMAALGDPAVADFGSGFLPLLEDSPDLASSVATLRDLSLSHSPTLARTQQHSRVSDAGHSSASPTLLITQPTDSDQLEVLWRVTTNASTTPAEQAAEKARLERIADKTARELIERATAHARKAVPVQTAHPSVNSARHLAGISPHIILDAKKATGKESLYLSAIGRRLRERGNRSPRDGGDGGLRPGPGTNSMMSSSQRTSSSSRLFEHQHTKSDGRGNHHHVKTAVGGSSSKEGKENGAANASGGAAGVKDGKDWDERVANAWPLFWKYFNGRSALERIALQEEMKRKDAWNLLTAMSEYLLCVRHW